MEIPDMMNINEQYKLCSENIMLSLYITAYGLLYWQIFAESALNLGMDKRIKLRNYPFMCKLPFT